MLPERYKYWVNKLIDSFKSYDTRTRVGVLIHRTLGGLAGTVLLALPHPPSPQCCHSSSSSWERPSCKRTSEGSHQPHNQLFLPQVVHVEDAQREKVPHHKRSRTPVGRWRCSAVFNSKITNSPNCCAVEQQLGEPPTSTAALPRSFLMK